MLMDQCLRTDACLFVPQIEECLTSAARWYVDPITSDVHLSGRADLCVTGYEDNDELYVLPCVSCAIGTESRNTGPLVDAPFLSSVVNVSSDMTATSLDGEDVPEWVYSNETIFLVNDRTTAYTFGVILNKTSGYCFGYNDSIPGWYEMCEFQPSDEGDLYGVFQSMYTSGLGGYLRGVVWDEEGCGCRDVCPSVISIEGVRGKGAVLEESGSGQTIYAGGYGFVSGTPVIGTPGGCTGRAVTSRVWIQPISSTEFDIETGNLELVNLTERTSRFGAGVMYSSTHALPKLSIVLYVILVLLVLLNGIGLVGHVALIVYKHRLVSETLHHYKTA
jgi:hypothetical protein